MAEKNPLPQDEKTMSFWDHLEELRKVLVRSALAVTILSVIAFLNREFIFDSIVLAPTKSDFLTNKFFCWAGNYFSIEGICMDNSGMQIINLNMSGQFMTHMYISFIAGVFVAFPFILSQIWRFIRPALHAKEASLSGWAIIASSLLFFIGALFSFYMIIPMTINFFSGYQVSDMVSNQISLTSYISTFVSLNFGIGLVFELPVLVFFLTKIGIVTPAFLKKNRKYTLVILLIIAAIITPPDMFTQILTTIPLVGLYELSILVSSRVYKKQQAAAA
ncbi:MAG: twin-arginine translocase subunit TatC [Bacteroidales bacterium]|nr:twin-arginine translocase subunit TatC [Bacteroidales bacterium]